MKIKQGDTLSISATFVDAAGVPVDLTLYTLASVVRWAAFSAVLVITKADQTAQPGVFTMAATAAVTASWPVASLVCDVKFTDFAGVVQHTDTFSIVIEQPITT